MLFESRSSSDGGAEEKDDVMVRVVMPLMRDAIQNLRCTWRLAKAVSDAERFPALATVMMVEKSGDYCKSLEVVEGEVEALRSALEVAVASCTIAAENSRCATG